MILCLLSNDKQNEIVSGHPHDILNVSLVSNIVGSEYHIFIPSMLKKKQ